MPLDAICLSAVVRETAAQVENTRIEKIQQPARDQVVLLLRGGRRLLLCAGATQPRAAPDGAAAGQSLPAAYVLHAAAQAPGGRAHFVRCPGAPGAGGDPDHPGRRRAGGAAPVASDPGGHAPARQSHPGGPPGPDHRLPAAGGLRDVPAAAGAAGLFYHLPPRQEKRSPLEIGREEFLELLSALPEDTPLDGWLLDTFTALPPLMARELVCAAYGETDARFGPGTRAKNCGQPWDMAGQNRRAAASCPPCCAGPAAGGFYLLSHHPIRPGHGAGNLRFLRPAAGRIL